MRGESAIVQAMGFGAGRTWEGAYRLRHRYTDDLRRKALTGGVYRLQPSLHR